MVPTFREYCRYLAQKDSRMSEGLDFWNHDWFKKMTGRGPKPEQAPAATEPSVLGDLDNVGLQPTGADIGRRSREIHGEPRSFDLPSTSPFASLGRGSKVIGGMTRRKTPQDLQRERDAHASSIMEPRLSKLIATGPDGEQFRFHQGNDGNFYGVEGPLKGVKLRGYRLTAAKEAFKKYVGFAQSDDWDGHQDIHAAMGDADYRTTRQEQIAGRAARRASIADRERARQDAVRKSLSSDAYDEDGEGVLPAPTPSRRRRTTS